MIHKTTISKFLFCLIAAMVLYFNLNATTRSKEIKMSPDTVSVLNNPLNGWVMYLGRDWDGDFLTKKGYDKIEIPGQGKTINVIDYATTAYLRTSWRAMEPTKGKYFWTDPDNNLYSLINSVLSKGIRIAFRIVVDGRDQGLNTPQYVFDEGAAYYLQDPKFPERKTPYPQDSVFRKCYSEFIEAFAAEFNSRKKTAFIDGYGLGKWGEGHDVIYDPGNIVSERTTGLKEDTMRWITELYSRNFTEVPLVINYHRHIGHPQSEGRTVNPDSERMLQIAIDNGYCLRSDAIGMTNQEWGYNDWERSYVKKWKYRLPIIMEGGWLVRKSSWHKDPAGYKTPRDLRMGEFVISREEGVNMMDLRAGGETESWFQDAFDLVNEFVTKGGYRLYPYSVTIPVKARKNTNVSVSHSWRNLGWGYFPNNLIQFNYRYKPAIALLDMDGCPVKVFVDKDAEPSEWIKEKPGQYQFSFNIGKIPSGRYTWAIAIVDSLDGNVPAVELAIPKDRVSGGWVRLSDVKIR